MVLRYPSSLNNLSIERWKRHLDYFYICISWKSLQILYADFHMTLSSISEENGECSCWLACCKHMLGFAKRMHSYSSRVNSHTFLLAKWRIQFSASTTRLGITDSFSVSYVSGYLLLSHSVFNLDTPVANDPDCEYILMCLSSLYILQGNVCYYILSVLEVLFVFYCIWKVFVDICSFSKSVGYILILYRTFHRASFKYNRVLLGAAPAPCITSYSSI